MTKLPVPLNESEMVVEISEWVETIQEKMSASYTREWLEAALREHLQKGLVETLKVIEWAERDKCPIADAALRRVYAEMRDRREEPPVTLEAYIIKTLERGAVPRGRGHFWFDNWRRDIGVACLVYAIMQRYGLRPTRNREQHRRRQPSASSMLAEALGRRRVNLSESRVQNIWLELQDQVAAYLQAMTQEADVMR
jgi:hypothetical protein